MEQPPFTHLYHAEALLPIRVLGVLRGEATQAPVLKGGIGALHIAMIVGP
jgi:hypothetical protein